MSKTKYKRISALNIAILSFFLMVWFFSYMLPILRSFTPEEHLFYGNLSYISNASLFGNTNIPFLDRQSFNINNDKEAHFKLYLSGLQKSEMNTWFRWWDSKTQSPIPLEIKARRIHKDTWIVKGISTSEGSLETKSVQNYHLRISFWGLLFTAILFGISLRSLHYSLKKNNPS